jgi:hypothetical protein
MIPSRHHIRFQGDDPAARSLATPAAAAAAAAAAAVGRLGVGMSLNEMDARGLGTPAAAAKEEEPAQEVAERRNQSKYDFVKVRVWVEDHVYVLSRYLVSRALVGTKVRDVARSSS